MDQEIEISYVWDVEQFLRAGRGLRRGQPGKTFYTGLAIVTFLGLVIYLSSPGVPVVAAPARRQPPTVAIVLTVLALLWAYWTLLGGREQSERQAFHKAGDMVEPNQTFVIAVDETRFRKRSPSSEATWTWELVSEVIEARDGFLVIHSGMAEWLPIEGFARLTEADRFAAMAARRARKFTPNSNRGSRAS